MPRLGKDLTLEPSLDEEDYIVTIEDSELDDEEDFYGDHDDEEDFYGDHDDDEYFYEEDVDRHFNGKHRY